ncbi:MAG: DUF359 domain-containing protein [Candidatus Lokiarchaeota archaeon]|nr:DUF359 domain-containing protein [Candidatus Lokiarchaeota archaeon]
MDLNKDYFLNYENRKLIERPKDNFFTGPISKNVLKIKKWFHQKKHRNNNYKIHCVGDIVTTALINDPQVRKHIKTCIIDQKTHGKSQPFHSSDVFDLKLRANNSGRGWIRSTAILALYKSINDENFENKSVLVQIEGEEDLLVAPLILFVREGDYVIYGQNCNYELNPPLKSGLVIVEVTKIRKEEIKKVLTLFETMHRN